MSYETVNSLIGLKTSLQVSGIVGILCYIILRSGLTKKDDSMIVLLISSIIALISNLIWTVCNDIWVNIIFAIFIPITLAYIIRSFGLIGLFLEKIFNCTEYGDNIYLIRDIPNPITAILIFLKSGEVLVASAKYNEIFLGFLKNKAHYIDNERSLFIRVLASFKSKEDLVDVSVTSLNHYEIRENDCNHIKFRYIYSDAIESIEIEYQKKY